jgi:hypothetical protein
MKKKNRKVEKKEREALLITVVIYGNIDSSTPFRICCNSFALYQ